MSGVRRAFPRSRESHERRTVEILHGFALRHDWQPALPVPIERIIEEYFDLRLLYDRLHEPPDRVVLGELLPAERTIVLNEARLDLFGAVVGPERFTLAHELGHWVYDVAPGQLSLLDGDDGDGDTSVWCDVPAAGSADLRVGVDGRVSGRVGGDVREVNANKFAACLLLPGDLVRLHLPGRLGSSSAQRGLAGEWGVSVTALRIRLKELGLESRVGA